MDIRNCSICCLKKLTKLCNDNGKKIRPSFCLECVNDYSLKEVVTLSFNDLTEIVDDTCKTISVSLRYKISFPQPQYTIFKARKCQVVIRSESNGLKVSGQSMRPT